MGFVEFVSNFSLHIGNTGQIIAIWIAVGLTLCMLSFLYKDNPFFKFAEHLYLGVSNGYWIVYVWQQVIKPELLGRLIPTYIFDPVKQADLYSQEPKMIFIVPGLLGLFLLMRMVPSISWLSRWSLAFYIGWGSGVAVPTYLATYILAQATSTFNPLFGPVTTDTPISVYANNWLIFLGVIAAIVYFFFSVEHKGVVGKISKIGIWTLMLAFGASFGSTVMARVSLFIGRARFLVQEGGTKDYGYPFYYQLGLIIVVALVFYFINMGKPKKEVESPA
jgi:hypothetical protein